MNFLKINKIKFDSKQKFNRARKKIVFFLINSQGGGGEKVVLDLAKGFVEDGFEVDLLLFSRGGSLEDRIDTRINIVDLGVSRILFSVFPIIKYLQKQKPMAILGTSKYTNIILLLAKIILRTKTKILVRVGIVFSDVFGLYNKRRDKLIPFLIQILYPRADWIIANSQNVAKDLIKTSKIPKNKIKVIYNPKFIAEIIEKSLDRFANAREDGRSFASPVTIAPQSSLRACPPWSKITSPSSLREATAGSDEATPTGGQTVQHHPSLRETERSEATKPHLRVVKQSRKQNEWNFNKDKFTILAIGRLEKQKDFATLIEAFNLVRQKIDAQLIILGEGGERKNLENLAEKLGIKNLVYFLGFVQNPYFYMANANVFVSTSLWEGFSNVLIEATIFGLPIIATDCGSGSRELLAPQTDLDKQLAKGKMEYADFGILVAKQDVENLTKAILKLQQDRKLFKNYSQKLKQRSQIFEIKQILKEYQQLF